MEVHIPQTNNLCAFHMLYYNHLAVTSNWLQIEPTSAGLTFQAITCTTHTPFAVRHSLPMTALRLETVMQDWKSLEDEVRATAQSIWSVPFSSVNLHGRQIDAYAEHASAPIAYEVTVEKNINKIQDDVNKLVHVRNCVFQARAVAVRCHLVVGFEPTDMMRTVCRDNNIALLTHPAFRLSFLPFDSYCEHRLAKPFGSAVNPDTAKADERQYVFVQMECEQFPKCNIKTIKQLVNEGKSVVLTGEFGTGKSKAIAQLFNLLSTDAWSSHAFPMAIDIKKCWGLNDRYEILRRHLTELNLQSEIDAFIRAYNDGYLVLLLDGFDEIGLQQWTENPNRMKSIKQVSLAGVRDLIGSCKNSVVVCGREHFFDSLEEMKSCLGLTSRKPVFVRTNDEFSFAEIETFLGSLDIKLPSWLPRKPLSCDFFLKVASEIKLGQDGPELEHHHFWGEYLTAICKRESTIHRSFDEASIKRILVSVAMIARTKAAGSAITLQDLEAAFRLAVGYTPIEQGAVLLQRLPGLGRLSSESSDRQFYDPFIFDGLCAQGVLDCIRAPNLKHFEDQWLFPLGYPGSHIVAAYVDGEQLSDDVIAIIKSKSRSKNATLLYDMLSALLISAHGDISLAGVILSNGLCGRLDFSFGRIFGLLIEETEIQEVIVANPDIGTVTIRDCTISSVQGISEARGLPVSFESCTVGTFTSLATNSRVKAANLLPANKVLITILRKTFFQRGSGREEEALLRGLGRVVKTGVVNRIVNKLIDEQMLYTTKGDSGRIYHPHRENANRANKILAELNASNDPIWHYVNLLN